MPHEGPGHLPLFRSPLVPEDKTRSFTSNPDECGPKLENSHLDEHDDGLDDPRFHRHAEATTAELFYDLFFVANLTVFTNVHEVNSSEALRQYIGFFCVLWFNWYQVSLYDVRFSTDSVFERSAKAIQFLVMIGFAITGPKFDVGRSQEEENEGSEGPSLVYYNALTLILMVSRLVLVFQYLQSLWFTRHFKTTIPPMLMIALTYFVAAVIYLGLFWSFHLTATGHNHSYVAWYVVAICETIIATVVSSVYRNISFKGTHLIQRMSLLTLIILGEGVIDMAKTCQKIVKSVGVLEFSGSTIGTIISAVLIIYFIYMLYFDWMEEEHFGTIRQQIWSFLHFPLHLALVLAVEGVAQHISWGAAIYRYNAFSREWAGWHDLLTPTEVPSSTYKSVADRLYETALGISHAALTNSATLDTTLDLLYDLPSLTNATAVISNGTSDPRLALAAMEWAYYNTVKTVINVAGFSPPVHSTIQQAKEQEAAEGEARAKGPRVDFAHDAATGDSARVLDETIQVFGLTFTYTFIAIGLVLIFCTLIAALSKREKRNYHWIRFGATTVVGVMLTFMSIIGTTDYGLKFMMSPWVLPTVVLVLFVAVVLNSIKPAFPKFQKKPNRDLKKTAI